jgi:hypothetical protein
VFGTGFHQEGLAFIFEEGMILGERLGGGVRILFLLVSALMLFSTQIGVLESSSRINFRKYFVVVS